MRLADNNQHNCQKHTTECGHELQKHRNSEQLHRTHRRAFCDDFEGRHLPIITHTDELSKLYS